MTGGDPTSRPRGGSDPAEVLFAHSREALARVDEDGVILRVNESFASAVRERREKLVGRDLAGLIGCELKSHLVEAHSEFPVTINLELSRCRASTLRILGQVVDATRTLIVAVEFIGHATEAEVTRLREQLDLTLRATNDAIWDWQVGSNVLLWSIGFSRLFGWGSDQIDTTLEWWAEHVHPDDRDATVSSLMRAIDDPTVSDWVEEYRFRRANGTWAWVIDRGKILRDVNGRAERALGGLSDITVLRQTEMERVETQRRFDIVAGLAVDAIWDWDIRDGSLWWSAGMTTLFGYPQEEIGPTTSWFIERVHPDDRDKLIASLAKVIDSEEERWQHEYRFQHYDGSFAHVHDAAAVIRDKHGRAIRMVGGMRDHSASTKMFRELEAKEKRFRKLIEKGSDAILLLDSEGQLVEIISSARGEKTRDPRAMPPTSLRDLVHEEDQKAFLAKVNQCARTKGAAISLRWRGHSDDPQREVWHDGVLSNYLDEPAVGAIVLNFRDVSHFVEAERDLIDRERYLQLALESARMGTWKVEVGGGIDAALEWSPQVFLIFEADPTTFRPQRSYFYSMVHPEDHERVRAAFDEAVATDTPYAVEHRIVLRDGRIRWVNERGVLARDDDGSPLYMAGIVQDVTEQVAARQALMRANTRLEERVAERTRELEALTRSLRDAKAAADIARDEAYHANEAKNEFLSRMSHELRTPMNAILGFAQLMQLHPELDKELSANVDQILAGGRHLLLLINEVLDISRIESGQIGISPEVIRLREVLVQSLEMVRPAIEQRSISVDWDTSGCEHTWIVADPNRLKQVFINLLSNAVKYNRERGRIRLYCEHINAETLRVFFVDTGFGIPPEKQERLFVPFDRLGMEQSEIEGSGLGLALSKRLVDVMKGRMRIESVPGEGTSVILDLVRAEEPTPPETPTPLPQRLGETEDANGQSAKTVLYIEDNLSNVQLIQRIFSLYPGVNLISAVQGGAGLELAVDQKPDLILLDLNLPDIEGYGVLARLRADAATASIPVIVVSADATPGQVSRLLDAGAAAYLTKPINVDEFLRTVRKYLEETSER